MAPPQPSTPQRTHPEVSRPVETSILWTLIALDLVFIVARLGIRIKAFKRLFWDDFLVVLAFLMFLSSGIAWMVRSPYLYIFYDMAAGKLPPTEKNIQNFGKFMHLIAPLNVLFYSALWSVKLSFLIFFRQFGSKIRAHAIWWRIVLACCVISWIGCIADIDWPCAVNDINWIIPHCGTLTRVAHVNRTFYANAALDVLTDLLILSIPIAILWNIRVAPKKKLVLFCIFGVTVFDMTIAIIRVTVVNSTKMNTDVAWLYFWSFVETGTAICIACIASFRQLFVTSHSTTATPASGPTTDRSSSRRTGFLSFLRSGKTFGSSDASSKTGGSSLPRWGSKTVPSNAKRLDSLDDDSADGHSDAHIMPLQNVHVHNSYNVQTEAPRDAPAVKA